MSTLSLAVEYDAVAELAVPYALAETHTHFAARGNGGLSARTAGTSLHWSGNLYPRPDFLDKFVGNLADES